MRTLTEVEGGFPCFPSLSPEKMIPLNDFSCLTLVLHLAIELISIYLAISVRQPTVADEESSREI